MDQTLDRLIGKGRYYILDGYSGYNYICVVSEDQLKTTLTCPYDMFAFNIMPFHLCNGVTTIKHCMMSIFFDIVENTMEVFMDEFAIIVESIDDCWAYFANSLQIWEEFN